MIKIKTDIGVGICFVLMSYVVAMFIGRVSDGTSLYVYEIEGLLHNNSSESLLIGITLWLIPKVLLSYYLANMLYRSYQNTYAYYFVRSRDSKIWIKKVFLHLYTSASLFMALKLVVASWIGFDNSLVLMAFLELLMIGFLATIIVSVLMISNSEKIAVLMIIVMIVATFVISKTQKIDLIQMVFMYKHIGLFSFITSSVSVINIVFIYKLLKHKEFYY